MTTLKNSIPTKSERKIIKNPSQIPLIGKRGLQQELIVENTKDKIQIAKNSEHKKVTPSFFKVQTFSNNYAQSLKI